MISGFLFFFGNCYDMLLYDYCYCFNKSTVEATGHREGGDVMGCLLVAIMILDDCYDMHTYLRYA